MVALEGLGEVCLIELAGLPLPDVELGRIFLQALDEPVALVHAILRQTPQRSAHSRSGSMRTKHSA